MKKYISGEEVVRAIKSGDRVFVNGGAATGHSQELERAAFERFKSYQFERTYY